MKIEIEDKEQQLFPHNWELLTKKIQLFVDMQKFAMIENDGWVSNWKKYESAKWGLIINDGIVNERGVRAVGMNTRNSFVFGVTVKTLDIAEKMKEQFGDRINEIYNTQL